MGDAAAIRQREVSEAFVTLADSLMVESDLGPPLDRLVHACVEILSSASAGLLLTDQHGRLRVMSSSSDAMQALEFYQLQNDEGPCVESFHSGAAISLTNLNASRERWPRFAAVALSAGFESVQALPMRRREQTIGALNLFHRNPRAMTDEDVQVAQALADVATIAILHHRAARRAEALAEQLQRALNSRLVIEQAKGKLAERGGLNVDQAFALLRGYCRSRHLPLSETSRLIVVGELDAGSVLADAR